MKASEYIVEFLIEKGITDIFGYPGGMVTQFMESLSKHADRICSHVTYHEQGAAFAACGYAQTSGKPGVAYATSGPGATNLITGICNAYFDSIPVLFITGQVNAYEAKGPYSVRQRGFQETDIVSIVKPVTKYAVYVENAESLQKELQKAYSISTTGRRGPVLIDIPMNVFRAEIHPSADIGAVEKNDDPDVEAAAVLLSKALHDASAPVFILGGGIKSDGKEERTRSAVNRLGIPVISSMIAFDVMKADPNYYGFIGAYGSRAANFIAAKADLVITIGTRLDVRQVGVNRSRFAPDAAMIRCDIDAGELEYRVHENETQLCIPIETVCAALERIETKDFHSWVSVCNRIRDLLSGIDDNKISSMIRKISEQIPDDTVITTDVGQNQVWVAQSFKLKPHQKVLFSGGHGAMGYSLPAAIGAYYGSGKKPVCCITGDGGMQMNIQELQFIAREQIPVKVIVLNNNALGMIRHFQEMYYASNYFQTKPEGGYTAPNFTDIAHAYGINSRRIEMEQDVTFQWSGGAELVEVMIREDTYVTPKLEFGKPNQDQEPLIDRALYEKIMGLSATGD